MSEDEKDFDRMGELFTPIEKQIMMLDDDNDQMLFAGCLLVKAKDLYIQYLGEEGARDIMKEFIQEIFGE